MSVPWILQRYLIYEMGKTFLLTALALAGVLGLGGGVREVIKLGEVTPGQLIRLLGLFVPVAAALTLPVAALFSAAAIYGRLSADNELVACRASGVNLHVLLLPALVISLVSAAVTFLLINFVMPGMIRNLDEFIRADLGVLVQQRLHHPKGIPLKRGRVYAERSEYDPESQRVLLRRAAFVEIAREEWVRFGTAEQADLVIQWYQDELAAAARLEGVTLYDRQQKGFAQVAVHDFSSQNIDSRQTQRIKFLDLFELLRFWMRPGEWHEVADAIERLRTTIGQSLVYENLLQSWSRDGEFVLRDEKAELRVRADQATLAADGSGLDLVKVIIVEGPSNRRRTFTAARAVIEASRGDDLASGTIRVDAYEVVGQDGDARSRSSKLGLGPVAMPTEVVERVEKLTTADLLDWPAGQDTPNPIAKHQQEARDVLAETVRKIAATVHERMAFSFCVLVLVILGAALGIILRGSHAVVAFGIAFVPSLLVIVTIVAGKQLAQNVSTHGAGLVLIWSGITAVAAINGWVLTRVLRR